MWGWGTGGYDMGAGAQEQKARVHFAVWNIADLKG